MTEDQVFFLTLLFSTILFSVLGYLLKYKHMVQLISGYDPKKIRDGKKMAECLGGHLFNMAWTALICCAAYFMLQLTTVVTFYAIAMTYYSIKVVYDSQKFYKPGYTWFGFKK